MKEISTTNHRWRDRSNRSMSWLWFSCLALLFLLPPVSFAQSHLWQYRPFRANDTDHSGGDHICDLRRDSNADGKPDRLGDYVTVLGSVIVEPSTFETGGRLFWIREDRCGIPVCGEPENLRLGDSVMVRGRVRLSSGGCLFPGAGPADLDDIVLAKGGTTVRYGTGDQSSLPIPPEDYAARPGDYGGNLVTLTQPVQVTQTLMAGGDCIYRRGRVLPDRDRPVLHGHGCRDRHRDALRFRDLLILVHCSPHPDGCHGGRLLRSP